MSPTKQSLTRAPSHKTLEATPQNQSHLPQIRRDPELRPCVDLGNPQISFKTWISDSPACKDCPIGVGLPLAMELRM